MIGEGTSYGCISVMNGIVSGTGAVIGIDLATHAVYREEGTAQEVEVVGEQTDTGLARICVRRALESIGADPSVGYHLSVSSDIPPSRGLKSSSSVCNAVIKAVYSAHGAEADVMDIIELGVQCAKEARVTVTGSFDDAVGCELGGFIVTDNRTDTILRKEPVDPMDAIVFVPERVKVRVPRESYEARAADMEMIKEVCLRDPLAAMTMNGRLIAEITGESQEIIDDLLEAGALAAGISGTGPAVAALCRKGEGKGISARLPYRTLLAETR